MSGRNHVVPYKLLVVPLLRSLAKTSCAAALLVLSLAFPLPPYIDQISGWQSPHLETSPHSSIDAQYSPPATSQDTYHVHSQQPHVSFLPFFAYVASFHGPSIVLPQLAFLFSPTLAFIGDPLAGACIVSSTILLASLIKCAVCLFSFFLFLVLFFRLVRLCYRCYVVYSQSAEPHLSGSRFAAAAGIHPYVSRQRLWLELTKRYKEKDSAFAARAKEWGIRNESAALEVYSALRLNKVVTPNRDMKRHKEHTWLLGIPDALISDSGSNELEGIVEVKCPFGSGRRQISTGHSLQLRDQVDPDLIVPHQTVSSIFYYMPQVQGYMEIVGVDYCDFVSYTKKGSNIFRFKRDPEYWNLLFSALQEFWVHLCLDTMPAEEHRNTARLLELSREMPWTKPEEDDPGFAIDFDDEFTTDP